MIHLFLLLTLCIVNNINSAYAGEWLNKTKHDNRSDSTPIRFYAESKSYTTEGITITFPKNYFSNPPLVQATIQHDSTTNNTPITFYSLITARSASMTKINVYKVNAGIIHDFTTEADNDEVIVHVLAFGN